MPVQIRRGRPPRTTPDTRTASEKLAARLTKRRAKALQDAAVFNSLPDFARIKQPVIEVLFSKSHATIWRDVSS